MEGGDDGEDGADGINMAQHQRCWLCRLSASPQKTAKRELLLCLNRTEAECLCCSRRERKAKIICRAAPLCLDKL